jgi:IPT/TIG domain
MFKTKRGLFCIAILLVMPTMALTQRYSQGAQKNKGGGAPTLTSISPTSVTAGGPAFTLTAVGTNFASNAVVLWNGATLTTTVVSGTEVQAAIPNNDHDNDKHHDHDDHHGEPARHYHHINSERDSRYGLQRDPGRVGWNFSIHVDCGQWRAPRPCPGVRRHAERNSLDRRVIFVSRSGERRGGDHRHADFFSGDWHFNDDQHYDNHYDNDHHNSARHFNGFTPGRNFGYSL